MLLTKYWLSSLMDAEFLDIGVSKKPTVVANLSLEIRNGKLTGEYIEQAFNKIQREVKSIEILIAPLVFKSRFNRLKVVNTKIPQTMCPLWIPALLDRDGNLHPPQKNLPWISRDYLEPLDSELIPIGRVEIQDSYYSNYEINRESWDLYYEFVLGLFKSVTGSLIDEWQHEQYIKTPNCYLYANLAVISASRSVQLLYKDILATKVNLSLYNQFSSIKESTPIQINENKYLMSKKHTGQMSNQFALSPSQRVVINHSSIMKNGELIAVNGPPGTGKTTLLQSVVATTLIDHILENKDAPIIVVSSTNNNAVTNVIQSFGRVTELPGNRLVGRWIPYITSYGSYMKSKGKETNFDIPTAEVDGELIVSELDEYINLEYLEYAKKVYLDNCTKYFCKRINDIDTALIELKSNLIEVVNEIEKVLEMCLKKTKLESIIVDTYNSDIEGIVNLKYSEVAQIKSKLGSLEVIKLEWIQLNKSKESVGLKRVLEKMGLYKTDLSYIEKFAIAHDLDINNVKTMNKWLSDEETKCNINIAELEKEIADINKINSDYVNVKEDYNEILKKIKSSGEEDIIDSIDKTLRYNAFKIAVHYWEGKWLLKNFTQLTNAKDNIKLSLVEQRKDQLRNIAMVTPCFATTLYMLPSFFSVKKGKDYFPLHNFIDMLIIDEAGQVVAEVGGAAFSLAKKAVIVGDTEQIQPVWSIPPFIDKANLADTKITNKYTTDLEVEMNGYSASSGSIMKVAKNRTNYTNSFESSGFLLTEHRRCVPEIIEYCNVLAYEGKLEAKRKPIEDYFLPHMGYAHIEGIAKKSGGSYQNTIEAKVIVQWIISNQDLLVRNYENQGLKTIEKIIAVVTPFSSQKNLITSFLQEEGITEITVGTVHALQGDERPIVIFSSVYDNTYSNYFFDRSASMLNVAVSRARDSFLVFGDMTIFKIGGNTSSNILAKFLFKSEANEIKSIDISYIYNTKLGETLEFLNSTQKHFAFLINAIFSARSKLVIVSPWIKFNVISDTNLIDAFESALNKNVDITIYTDEGFNKENGKYKDSFIKAKKIIEDLGITVIILKRIHSKLLWLDDSMFVVGSCNWLSAVRDEDNQYSNLEMSLIYRGEKVNQYISESIKAFDPIKT